MEMVNRSDIGCPCGETYPELAKVANEACDTCHGCEGIHWATSRMLVQNRGAPKRCGSKGKPTRKSVQNKFCYVIIDYP